MIGFYEPEAEGDLDLDEEDLIGEEDEEDEEEDLEDSEE